MPHPLGMPRVPPPSAVSASTREHHLAAQRTPPRNGYLPPTELRIGRLYVEVDFRGSNPWSEEKSLSRLSWLRKMSSCTASLGWINNGCNKTCTGKSACAT